MFVRSIVAVNDRFTNGSSSSPKSRLERTKLRLQKGHIQQLFEIKKEGWKLKGHLRLTFLASVVVVVMLIGMETIS